MATENEFYVQVAKKNLRGERSKQVRYCSCHKDIKVISWSSRVMFFVLYRHNDDGVFDDFPKISDHFPEISENSQKLALSESHTDVAEHISKTVEDY